MLLHTEALAFARRIFYHKSNCRQTVFQYTFLMPRNKQNFYTQTLLQANASTHRQFYKYTALHTDNAFTHGPFYTQTLLHTEALKQKKQKHLETENLFTKSFKT